MCKFVMLGMDEEHAKFLYDLVKKDIDTIDTIMEKECYENLRSGIDEWLKNRRKLAEQTIDLLSWTFT